MLAIQFPIQNSNAFRSLQTISPFGNRYTRRIQLFPKEVLRSGHSGHGARFEETSKRVDTFRSAVLVTAHGPYCNSYITVAIAVTYSGNQPEVAEALKSAHERRAFCVCITSFEQSLVSKSADTLLLISIPSETLHGQTGAHRVAQIAILDALAVRAGHLRTARMKGEKSSRVLRSLPDQISGRTGL
jgi:glucosamine 6-phosphate synthetase-like amidotransferase/phosphosugar isomerase protein